MALGLAVFFAVVTVRFYRRREPDATRIVHRLRPRALAATALRLAPWALRPPGRGHLAGARGRLGTRGRRGQEAGERLLAQEPGDLPRRQGPGPPARRRSHLDLFPERSRLSRAGTFDLVNDTDRPLREVLLTGGPHWEKLAWTMDGKPYSPDDRAHLFVFTPAGRRPRARAGRCRSDSSTKGPIPRGIGKRTAAARRVHPPLRRRPDELPAQRGARARASLDSVGIDDENRHDSKEYPDDFYEGQTDSFIGCRTPFTTRITITGPAEFTLNSVGTKTEDSVQDGRRTVVWESEHPVSFFNVVAGPMGGRAGRGDGRVLSSRPSLQHRRDARGARRGPPLLLASGSSPIPGASSS